MALYINWHDFCRDNWYRIGTTLVQVKSMIYKDKDYICTNVPVFS